MIAAVKEKTKKYILFISKVFITVGLLYFVIEYVSLEKIQNIFSSADGLFVIIAILLMPVSILFQFYKWKMICREYLNELNEKEVLSSLFQGYSAGLFTPLRTGEFFARKIPLKYSSIKKVTLATFIDKFSSMFALLIIGGLFTIILIVQHKIISSEVFFLFIVCFVILIYLLKDFVSTGSLLNRIANYFKKIKFFEKFIDKLVAGTKVNKSVLKNSFILSLPIAIVIPLQYAFLYFAFDPKINLFDGFLSANAILLVKNIIPPITFGETGVREAISMLVFDHLSFDKAVAVNAAIMIFFINLIIPALAGLFFTLRSK